MKAIYPGTFDPVTYGHIDIIKRSAALADELIIGVLKNYQKTPMFSPEERADMLSLVTKDMPNVKVKTYYGLLADFAKSENADFIIRGLRAVTDFENEIQMAQTNMIIAPELDTIFLAASLEHLYLSSSTVREVCHFGGDISKFVPKEIEEIIFRKIAEEKINEQN